MPLGLIRKTHTVVGKDGLARLEKQMYVLCLGLSLPCHDFEFSAIIILGMFDPVKDIRLWFGH